jgi:hypothetical protein
VNTVGTVAAPQDMVTCVVTCAFESDGQRMLQGLQRHEPWVVWSPGHVVPRLFGPRLQTHSPTLSESGQVQSDVRVAVTLAAAGP